MSSVLEDITVLDLSRGIAGPMATMLLADHGARVTRIEGPGPDPFSEQVGYRVWHRGKRSAVLDLEQPADRGHLLALAGSADVLVESFRPGATERLGIDFATLHERNPRLIYCSITGYGRGNRHSDRPAYDALVAARTGLHWEQRGVVGGPLHRFLGREGPHPDLPVPDGAVDGAQRDGPLFPASRWPSLAAAYLATTGISAALRAREITGRGQWVETSLLQGALAVTGGAWQRVADPDAPLFWMWVMDQRAPKGLFQCADGRWVHHWVPNPNFVLGSAAASPDGELKLADEAGRPRDDPDRIGIGADDLVVLFHYFPLMRDAFARFPSDQWVRAAAEAGVPLQPIRPPVEALLDPWLLADGCVAEVADPELGPLRQVGVTYQLSATPGRIRGPAPKRGEHTDEVVAEARATPAASPRTPAATRALGSPLEGITVLDLGLAVAGPFGTQVLADLGAEVIKVNALYDNWWHSTHIAFASNRGKRSIAVNLKDERGMAVLHRLVERADVVHHNMRMDAATRLGVDYESLRRINPRLVYCHTRGFERSPRELLPGNDQTGAALAGVEWEDGGCSDGGRPIWSLTSMGDTGNGYLSAIAVIQALYHRERTGQGQQVDTSIVNACLLNTSYTYATPTGEEPDRARLDGQQLGLNALYRLYRTSDGWLCVTVLTDDHWHRLCAAIDRAAWADDDRFATTEARRAHDQELAAEIGSVFASRSATAWFEALDTSGVPCEISSPTFPFEFFDDPEMIARGWVASYPHPQVGHLEHHGLLIDLSETPGRIWGPPLVVGQDTRAILAEIGYGDDEVDAMCAEHVVLAADVAAPAATR